MSKHSRIKGYNYQRTVAKLIGETFGLDWKEHAASTPQSGGMKWKGDIQKSPSLKSILPIHIECKNQKTWALRAWIEQAQSDCPPDEIPTVIFHQHNTSQDFIVLPLQDFLNLIKGKD